MNALLQKPASSFLIAGFFCLVLYCVGAYCRPLFPVDETRYLSVAWEMLQSGNWLVPHLNYELYDQKPPLLFWCINLIWALLGVSQEAAMALPLIFAFIFVLLCRRFAGRLLQNDSDFALLQTLTLVGSLPFLLYSNLIMFDLLLGIFAVTGLTAVWDYAAGGGKKHLALFALAMGFGILAKGPVILLHLVFPVLLLRVWHKEKTVTGRQWAAGFGLAALCGAVIALSWAIPAAIKGGPEFAQKIFLKQTTGRLSNAFDHEEPFWWYLPLLPLFFMPWIFSPLFWRGLKTIKTPGDKKRLAFLVASLLPAFICFCFVSGKQAHYLLPMMAPLSALIALTICRADHYRPRDAVPPWLFTSLAILLPVLILFTEPYLEPDPEYHFFERVLQAINPVVPIALFASATILQFALARKGRTGHILAVSLSMLLMMVSIEYSAKDGLFKNYDLRPIAQIVRKNPGAPLAFTRNYHGEWGFMARTTKPVREIDAQDLPQYFSKHPDGIAFVRTGHEQELEPYDVLFTMPYKMTNTYAVIVKRGQAHLFSK